MAYSDYGGYAYRNGVRVVERSDCTITPDGDTFGTPGSWPGFAMLAAGIPNETVQERIKWPSGHVVIGDGPVYVMLYKQSGLRVYLGPVEHDVVAIVPEERRAGVTGTWTDLEGTKHVYLDDQALREGGEPLCLEFHGCRISAYFTDEDNCYLYVRLEQPDGTIWHGWSGYGVGAGLEDCGYGYSTEDREDTLIRIWPDAIAEAGPTP